MDSEPRHGQRAGIENADQMKTLENLFKAELADMYDAEHRITKALPKLAKAATCPDLKRAFQKHLKETKGHVKKLEQVFRSCGQKARGKTCEATVGLLEEGDEIAAEFKGSPAINAALIAAAQKVEHYEVATYGCLHTWARQLGNSKAASLLKQVLDEEKEADNVLNELALSYLNQAALGETNHFANERPGNLRRGNGRPVEILSILR
jgi:ferritin-like metal-binding protein YciE